MLIPGYSYRMCVSLDRRFYEVSRGLDIGRLKGVAGCCHYFCDVSYIPVYEFYECGALVSGIC